MSCVVDKADGLRVLEADSHFSDFTGMHPSKISQGKLYLLDLLNSKDREDVMRKLCKKNSPYVYPNFYIKNKNGDYVYVHCIGQSIAGTTKSRLAFADVSRSAQKSEMLRHRADEMNRLIDLVEGGVCLFKVHHDMSVEPLYMNKTCRRFFGTAKDVYIGKVYRFEELFHTDDKSSLFQAIGSAMATHKPINMELRIMTHRDSFIWCKLDSAIQHYDGDGCPIFHAVFTDISKIKEAEQEADNQRDIMINAFKNCPGPLFLTDLDTPFIMKVVTHDFINLIGYSREELFEGLGGDLTHLIVPEDAERAERELAEGAAAGNVFNTTYSIKTKDGRLLEILDRRRVVENIGADKSTIGLLRDASMLETYNAFEI